ncbi:uncharacterized protein LOC142977316 isoform X1 [Anticarsia gemmatalis]|uniref:uncharacterized protein LOC142977316 isoform X1 n=1 Tax=Anticarsia gemmatalis TaxID=129554 RepID=UPI003F76B41A
MTFELENCCYCVDLKTGALILGYMSGVSNLILITIAVCILHFDNFVLLVAIKEFYRTEAFIIYVIMIVAVAILIISLIFNIILLIGLHQFKPKCVKAYLIYIGIYINITFGLLIASIIIGTEVRFVIRDLVQLLISFYTLLIVRSYYKVMNFPPQKPMIFHTYNNVEMTQRSQPECDQRGEPKALACERRQRASSEMDMVY